MFMFVYAFSFYLFILKVLMKEVSAVEKEQRGGVGD